MKRVTIIGCGALGSHVAMLLRNEAELTLIDFDKVEAKNTLSQFFGKPALGKNKAEALKQNLNFLWGLKPTVLPFKLTKDNQQQLLSKSDLLIDCLDNGEARRIVQAFAREHKAPCLHGALAPDGAFGRAVWDDAFVIDDGVTGAPTCEGGEHLGFIAITASHIAYAAQRFLRDGKTSNFSVSPAGVIRT